MPRLEPGPLLAMINSKPGGSPIWQADGSTLINSQDPGHDVGSARRRLPVVPQPGPPVTRLRSELRHRGVRLVFNVWLVSGS